MPTMLGVIDLVEPRVLTNFTMVIAMSATPKATRKGPESTRPDSNAFIAMMTSGFSTESE
ncbi:hypothetical protein D3C71_2204350 [compost metagenome]